MPELRVVIADDEPLVRQGLRTFIEADGRLSLVGEARTGLEAVAKVRALRPDLVLLDVEMPELDGFGVVEALGQELPPAMIFVTAFDAYAIRAFDVHAVDYLLKPFEEERFALAIARAAQRLGEPAPVPRTDAWRALLSELQAQRGGIDRLLVKSDGRVTVVPLAEVDWLEAADNYVKVHTRARTHMVRDSLKDLELQLPATRFARVHRSAIVQLDRVLELQPLFGGEYSVLLTTGTRLTLSRGYRDTFRHRLAGGAAPAPHP